MERLDAIAVGGIRDDALLRSLANAGLPHGGTVVDGALAPEEMVRRLSEATRSGLQVRVDGAKFVFPERLDGLQAGDEVLVYANLPEPLPVRLAVGDGPWVTPQVSVVERPLLERAWAGAKIKSLLERERVDGPSTALSEEIVHYSTTYRVLSPRTGLLVLETDQDYERFGIARTALADILVPEEGRVGLLKRAQLSQPKLVAAAQPPERKSSTPARPEMPTRPMTRPPQPTRDAPRPMPAPSSWRASASAPEAGSASAPGSASGSGSGSAPAPKPASAPAPAPEPASASAVRSFDLDAKKDAYDSREAPSAPAAAAAPPMRPPPPGDRFEPSPAAPPPPMPPPPAARASRAVPQVMDESTVAVAADEQPPKVDPYTGLFKEVMDLLAAGRVDDALVAAFAWSRREPGDVLALVALGESFEAAGEATQAARCYGALIDLFPSRADMRRFAGERLERLKGAGALELAIDSYAKAEEQRPDHPASHRLLAFALLKKGAHEKAFEALVRGLAQAYPPGRFAGVTRILGEDLGLAAAAWIRVEPKREQEILRRLHNAGGTVESGPSLRFVLNWETDANDVDFHIRDSAGGHAFYSSRTLGSGGELYDDVTTGYGPECFTIRKSAGLRAAPYTIQAQYYSRGPMGYGMGKLEIIEHDGHGGLTFEERPFVVMTDQAFVDLGVVSR